ncbi:putative metalloprotease CJM1_0395 family protein [Campylobacter coli]|uniref:putative metalloprotease CJM1_0395 family protein n=1 Tax=Campylobacter coli TaxID=195 RepID=UPI001E2F6F7C|nr:putative metalloprotease CJM1_0395 family protein [Campylobacter coli]
MQIGLNYNYASNSSYYDKTQKNNAEQENTENTNSQNKDSKQNNEQTQMINGVELTIQQAQQVRELQSIDRNVKAHEAAHQAAGGGLAGAASFSYTRGPDNQMYATAGEVPIRMQKGRTPEETIANARQVVAAAMAPADPSPQDYKVAANALKMEFEVRAEATKLKAQEAQEKKEENEEKQENLDINNQDSKDNFEETQANKDFKNFIGKIYQQNSQNNPINFSLVS